VGRTDEGLPPLEVGGELLGRVPGKGSHLGEIPKEALGETAEEVTKKFLPHGKHIRGKDLLEISDEKLAREFTDLLTHFAKTNKDRLALFGLKDDQSAISEEVLAAIEIFLKRRGAGTPFTPPREISKELDQVFQFLRVGVISIRKSPRRMSLRMREHKPELNIEEFRTSLDSKKCEELGKAHADELGPIDKTVDVDPSTRDQECKEKPGKSERSLGCNYDIPPKSKGTLTPPANAPVQLK
jgi:hypothetical protein